MGTSTLPDALFGSIQYHPVISSRRYHDPIQFFAVKSHFTSYRRRSGVKRFGIIRKYTVLNFLDASEVKTDSLIISEFCSRMPASAKQDMLLSRAWFTFLCLLPVSFYLLLTVLGC